MSSRIDHRKVRKLIEDRKSGIKDEELFTSRLMCLHFEDIDMASTKVYNVNRKVRVVIRWQDNGFVACTDNQTVYINAANTFGLENCSKKNRYMIVQGLNGHELGHILFTDFLAMQSYFNYLSRGIWYPSAPSADTAEDTLALKEIFEYGMSDPEITKAVMKIAANINNIIEDGYIEDRVLRYFPGSIGQGLRFVRQLHYEDMPSVSELIEEESEERPMIMSILQMILSYVKFGKLKYGDAPLSDERVQLIFDLLPVLDRAVQSGNVSDRFAATNTVLMKAWKYIKSFLESIRHSSESSDGKEGDETSDTGTAGDGAVADSASDDSISDGLEATLSDMLESLIGTSTEAKGSTAPVTELSGSPSPSSETAAARAETASLAGDGDSSSAAENEDPASAVATGEPPEDSSGSPSGSGAERLDLGTIRDDDYVGFDDYRIEDDLDRLLEGIAERDTMRALEEMRTSELEFEANHLDYSTIHNGITVVIHRMASVSEDVKDRYDETAAPLLRISKLLQRSILQQLKDVQRGGKRTGLLMGRRMDTHALARNDGKCFYKNSLPQDAPQLAVGLLLDESGSMWSSNRALYARYTAIVIYDFCRSLGIPVTVYGHSTSYSRKYGHVLDMYSYAEFESIDDNDKYRLMDITARNNNRDGMALKYVAEKLVKRPEQERILILVSDGQPADDDYYGPAADEDLQRTVREYTKRGILFIAAAIGSDKDEIERIYGNAFMDITDLNTLPEKLTGVIKRHIRV